VRYIEPDARQRRREFLVASHVRDGGANDASGGSAADEEAFGGIGPEA
jgi:hypothetical protein